MAKIIIYTDGSCINQIGGYACLSPNADGTYLGDYGRVPYNPCTNNIAELYAVYKAIELFIEGDLEIYTDSKYVIGCLTLWYPNWIKNNWKTANKKPVLNSDLIKTILQLIDSNPGRKISFHHIQAHKGHIHNENADTYANMGRLQLP